MIIPIGSQTKDWNCHKSWAGWEIIATSCINTHFFVISLKPGRSYSLYSRLDGDTFDERSKYIFASILYTYKVWIYRICYIYLYIYIKIMFILFSPNFAISELILLSKWSPVACYCVTKYSFLVFYSHVRFWSKFGQIVQIIKHDLSKSDWITIIMAQLNQLLHNCWVCQFEVSSYQHTCLLFTQKTKTPVLFLCNIFCI